MQMARVTCNLAGMHPRRGGAGGTSKRKIKKAFINEVQRIIGVGAECNLDDLRNVADRVKCGLGEFPDLIDELHLNGILLKKANGNWQVLS